MAVIKPVASVASAVATPAPPSGRCEAIAWRAVFSVATVITFVLFLNKTATSGVPAQVSSNIGNVVSPSEDKQKSSEVRQELAAATPVSGPTATDASDGDATAKRLIRPINVASDAEALAIFRKFFARASTAPNEAPHVVFIGTAHASDLFKVVCRWLRTSFKALRHNECPHPHSHVLSAVVTSRAKGDSVGADGVIASFVYRPLLEPLREVSTKVGDDYILADLLKAASHVVYVRGVLDLHHRNTPLNEFRDQIALRVRMLARVAPSATIIVYAPHRVYPAEPNPNIPTTKAMSLFRIPSAVCVTLTRQKAYREALAEGARLAGDSAVGDRIGVYDPWRLTSTITVEQRRAAWMGHHYSEEVTRRIAASLFVTSGVGHGAIGRLVPCAKATEAVKDTHYDTDELAAPIPASPAGTEPEIPQVTPEPAAAPPPPPEGTVLNPDRECDCMVYAPRWCEFDEAERMSRNFPRHFKDGTYRVSTDRYPIPEDGFLGDQRTRNIGCGGLPFDKRYQDVFRWHRVRIDDRTPFKPLLLQMPCDLAKLPRNHAHLQFFASIPQTYPNTRSMLDLYREEQCFVFFAEKRDHQPHLMDAESCIASGKVLFGITGSSYGQNLFDYALSNYLVGMFHYNFTQPPNPDGHTLITAPPSAKHAGKSRCGVQVASAGDQSESSRGSVVLRRARVDRYRHVPRAAGQHALRHPAAARVQAVRRRLDCRCAKNGGLYQTRAGACCARVCVLGPAAVAAEHNRSLLESEARGGISRGQLLCGTQGDDERQGACTLCAFLHLRSVLDDCPRHRARAERPGRPPHRWTCHQRGGAASPAPRVWRHGHNGRRARHPGCQFQLPGGGPRRNDPSSRDTLSAECRPPLAADTHLQLLREGLCAVRAGGTVEGCCSTTPQAARLEASRWQDHHRQLHRQRDRHDGLVTAQSAAFRTGLMSGKNDVLYAVVVLVAPILHTGDVSIIRQRQRGLHLPSQRRRQ
jgi:hypothetical protein